MNTIPWREKPFVGSPNLNPTESVYPPCPDPVPTHNPFEPFLGFGKDIDPMKIYLWRYACLIL
jgi:hypothetical protein